MQQQKSQLYPKSNKYIIPVLWLTKDKRTLQDPGIRKISSVVWQEVLSYWWPGWREECCWVAELQMRWIRIRYEFQNDFSLFHLIFSLKIPDLWTRILKRFYFQGTDRQVMITGFVTSIYFQTHTHTHTTQNETMFSLWFLLFFSSSNNTWKGNDPIQA